MNIDSVFVSLAAGTILRSLILAVFCAVAVWLLRSQPAALRFSLWKWTLLALFALPVMLCFAPPPVPQVARPLTRIQFTRLPHMISRTVTVPQPQISSSSNVSPLLSIYLLGVALLLGRLLYNLRQLQRLAGYSTSIADPAFRELANELWLASGARLKPNFACSAAVRVPITFRTLSDVWILLPPAWTDWDDRKLCAALTHELAHIQRGDSETLLVASLATCLFWFYPLSWFVRSQLSRLAEEACDEAVLASAITAEDYSRILIEFAQDVRRQRGRRISLPAAAVVSKANLQRRLEKLFCQTRPLKAWLAAGFALLFSGTFYLSAAARLQPQAPPPKVQIPSMANWNLGPGAIKALKSAVETNPQDFESRVELMAYYASSSQETPYLEHALWFVRNQPALEGAADFCLLFSPIVNPLSDTGVEQLRAAWEQAVHDHPDSEPVLRNAATFLQRKDPMRGIQLLQRAATASPNDRSAIRFDMSTIYLAAEMQGLEPKWMLNNIQVVPEVGAQLRAHLAATTDADLVASVALSLAGTGRNTRFANFEARAKQLMDRANQLDPLHSKDRARGLDMFGNIEELRKQTARITESYALRLAPATAEANLIHHVEPVYPPDAKAAGIEGVVEFDATIGTDGKVSELTLVRGDPALVNAAKDAAFQSVYQVPSQDGNPVPFSTKILVSFRM